MFFDSIFANLIQVEATCIRKKHQKIPQMKVLYGLFLTTNDVENWKVKSWTSTGFKGQEKNEKNEKVKLAWSQGFGWVRESDFKLDVICSSSRQFCLEGDVIQEWCFAGQFRSQVVDA